MRVLDVEEQRARDRIGTVGDRVRVRLDPVDRHRLQRVLVLVEERVAEDAQRVRILHQTLHDQVVVLAGFDERAVLAHARADRFPAVLVGVLEGGDRREGVAAVVHHELDEGITGARRRRRAEHHDRGVGQRRVDVAPGLERVRDDVAAELHLGGQRLENLRLRQVEVGAVDRVRDRKTVGADIGLGDVGHAVRGAQLELGAGHRPRGAGDVGEVGADAAAEQLHAAAGAGRFDHRGRTTRDLRELLRHRLVVREDGRRADHADLLADLGLRLGGDEAADRGQRHRAGEGEELQGCSPG
jgi:hypothetical protein